MPVALDSHNVSYMHSLARNLADDYYSYEKKRAPKRIQSHLEHYIQQTQGVLQTEGPLEIGWKRLNAIEKTLSTRTFCKRGKLQRECHRIFINSMLPHIFGKENWSSVRREVLLRRKITSERPLTLISLPRRHGKTHAVAQVIAATLFHVPNVTYAVYAQGMRISSALLRYIYDYFVKIDGARERILQYSISETLVVKNVCETAHAKSQVNAYPDNPTVCAIFSFLLPLLFFI